MKRKPKDDVGPAPDLVMNAVSQRRPGLGAQNEQHLFRTTRDGGVYFGDVPILSAHVWFGPSTRNPPVMVMWVERRSGIADVYRVGDIDRFYSDTGRWQPRIRRALCQVLAQAGVVSDASYCEARAGFEKYFSIRWRQERYGDELTRAEKQAEVDEEMAEIAAAQVL